MFVKKSKPINFWMSFVKRFYSWEKKAHEWTNFLTGVLNAKQ